MKNNSTIDSFFIVCRMFRVALSNAKYAYIKGGLRTSFFYFFARFFIPLGMLKNFKSYPAKANSSPTLHALSANGFAELWRYEGLEVSELVSYFISQVSKQDDVIYGDLNYYFDSWRRKGNIRPNGVYCIGTDNPISRIAKSDKLISIVSEYLGIDPSDLFYYGLIDSLILLNQGQIIYDNFDGAVEFHRDADAYRFVKVFVYLTDCYEGDGHHEFYCGSHLSFPISLLEIKRYSNECVASSLKNCRLIRVFGPSGTAVIENTLGFHRGTTPTKNDRLLLTLCYFDAHSSRLYPTANKVC
jgi:hypothetical protein